MPTQERPAQHNSAQVTFEIRVDGARNLCLQPVAMHSSRARPTRSDRPPPRLTLRPHELAWLLEIPRSRVKRMLQRGEIPNSSRGGHYRVGREDALGLIRERVRAGEASPLAELLLEALVEHRLAVSREEAGWLSLEAAFGRSEPSRAPPLHPQSRM